MNHSKLMLLLFILSIICSTGAAFISAQTLEPFYRNGTYDESISTPDDVLGFPLGKRPARHAEIVNYFRTIADQTDRVQVFEEGQTHEGRVLIYAIISSEENMARLGDIQKNLASLADPRQGGAGSDLIAETPAVALMMYSIHGDEISGSDASMQTAYQVAAGTDAQTEKIRKETLTIIYPMQNPDGRDRYLAQMQQWNGDILNSDAQSIQHTGVWPWGRTNHYLFDLNRDFFILAHPESRSRIKVYNEWYPQIVVDAHEMGSYDTFLFPPARDPFNPNIPDKLLDWNLEYSAAQAKALDQYGWSYYSREWLEEFYPGYSSIAYFYGAIAILYEQAQTDGTIVKRPDGTHLTFREAVHHQFISSIANLNTTADNREALLTDFHNNRKKAIRGSGAFILDPAKNPSRAGKLVERLLTLGIEVETANDNFSLKSVKGYWDKNPVSKSISKGAYVIKLDQPLRPLIHAILDFDTRMTNKFLQSERENLEKGKGTRVYDVISWSMPIAYNVDAYVAAASPAVKTTAISEVPSAAGSVEHNEPLYGFAIDYNDDNAAEALLAIYDAGLKVRSAQKEFRIEGKSFSRGTLLLRKHENPDNLADAVAKVAEETGVVAHGLNTAQSESGPDLGGSEFRLLTAPKIAMLTGMQINNYNFGAMWYMLDYELKQRFTIIYYENFNQMDLRKYNVLVLPTTWSPTAYKNILGKKGISKLKTWVQDGGTLIALGNGAAFLADSATGLSQVKLKRQALAKLADYEKALQLERSAGKTAIDSLAIWEGKTTAGAAGNAAEGQKSPDQKTLKELDKRQRLFRPGGSILNVELNPEHWLSFGVGERVPALMYTSYAYMAKRPVQTAGRFSEASSLRLSGLLWPEARERWANTAYVTTERKGSGQIVLFAHEANYRSYFYGTGKILLNAMILGPGFGTSQPVEF